MSHDPAALSPAVSAFLVERHLATLTTLRRDASPHVVAVGFTWDCDAQLARVITSSGSQKARNVEAAGGVARAVVCQVDGRRWLALEGRAVVVADPDRVGAAVARYRQRYRDPRPNPSRVVIEIAVDRVLGSVPEDPPAGSG